MKFTIYAVVAVVAAAAGFAIYRFVIEPHLVPAPAQVVDESTAPPTAAEEERPIPTVLPDFSLLDRAGVKRSIRSWPDKSMIVNFWATWCAPCRREIPLLKELQQQRGAEGFQVVGVAVDFREDVLKYAAEIGIDYPLLMGEQEGVSAVASFGMGGSIGLPFTVFTDRQQRIVATHLGELKAPQAQVILDAINRVNLGEITLESARVVVTKQLAELDEAEGESAADAA